MGIAEENMKIEAQKKSITLLRRRVTWTFQPAPDVQLAIEREYGDITAERGKLTQVCNDALRGFMPDAIRAVLEAEHQTRMALIPQPSSAPPSSRAGRFSGVAEKALSRERPARRRKP